MAGDKVGGQEAARVTNRLRRRVLLMYITSAKERGHTYEAERE